MKTMEERIEAANAMQDITGGKVWAKGNTVRIYVGKARYPGFVSVDDNCQPNIDAVKSQDFGDVKIALANAGYAPYRA